MSDSSDQSALARLIRPKSVAIFGGHWAAEVVRQCHKLGFKGDIWPVHPKHTKIEGLPVYKSVAELPSAPDAAFIGVNREVTVDIIRDLAQCNAGGAVCFSSGFSETLSDNDQYGQELQHAVIEASGEMPFLGPNCYGFINYFDRALLWPDQHGGQVLGENETGVAIIAQSSNMAINMTMQRRDLPIGYLMTVGNQAKIGLSQIGLAVLDDPRVTCLGLHVEGFDSIEGMQQLAHKAHALNKPVVILKVGKSEQAQAGALSHTASLAGAHSVSQAFMRRLGFAQVDSVPTFLDILKLIHHFGALPGNRLSAMVCSGGEASLIADMADNKNISFPPLTASAQQTTEAALGPMVTVANPLDFHTYIWADKEKTTAAFTGMLSGDFDLSILIQDFPQAPLADHGWQITAEAVIEAKQLASQALGREVNTVMVSSLSESMPKPELRTQYSDQGLPCFGGFEEILLAAEASAQVSTCWQYWAKHGQPPALLLVADQAQPSSEHTLNEHQAKQQLAEHGLTIPNGLLVSNSSEVLAAAKQLNFPLAIKALNIAHKTEMGAVKLNIQDENELHAACTHLFDLSDQLLLEQMITESLGELIIGVTRDPQFGLCLTLGLGGTMVELLQESVSLLLPSDERAIREALLSLKVAPLFSGYRNQTSWPLEATVQAVLAVQQFAIAQQHNLLELDINPLMLQADAAVAADALVRYSGTP